MKFDLEKASDWNFSEEIEFNNIEELANYVKSLDCNKIIIEYYPEDNTYHLTIYDDYIE